MLLAHRKGVSTIRSNEYLALGRVTAADRSNTFELEDQVYRFIMASLILAQSERWRRT